MDALPDNRTERLDTDKAREAAVRQYREFDKRPPFSYEVRQRADYYEEIDEKLTFEMEKKAFHGLENIPPLPPDLEEDHPLSAIYKKLAEEEFRLNEITKEVLDLEEEFSPEEIEGIIDNIRKASGLPTRKGLMKNHRRVKQRYLECLRAYLSIYIRSKEPETETKKEAERYYYDTQSVHLSHAVYTTVRSYIHHNKKKEGVLRGDNSITMHHLYSCAVHVINDYAKDIAGARASEDWDLEKNLYLERNKEIVIALLHDFFEDLPDVRREDLYDTLVALTRHETDLSGAACLDHPNLEPRPKDYNFIPSYWAQEIVPEVESMTKPPKGQRKGHLDRQLTTPRRIIRKGRDRGNNLYTLKYMQAKPDDGENAGQVQARKIRETEELVQVGFKKMQLVSPFDKERLKRSMKFIIDVSQEEIARLNKDHLEDIGEPIEGEFFRSAEEALAA